MIANGYVLDLYCDVPGCLHGQYGRGPGNVRISDYDSRADAARAARRLGWKIDWKNRTAVCPGCAKERKKP